MRHHFAPQPLHPLQALQLLLLLMVLVVVDYSLQYAVLVLPVLLSVLLLLPL